MNKGLKKFIIDKNKKMGLVPSQSISSKTSVKPKTIVRAGGKPIAKQTNYKTASKK